MPPEKKKRVTQYGANIIIMFIVTTSIIVALYFYDFYKDGLILSYLNDLNKISEIKTNQINELLIVCFGLLLILIFISIIIIINKKRINNSLEYLSKFDEEIQTNEKYLNDILKYSNDIILLMDLKGNVIKVNNSACEKYGYTEDEILRNSLFDLTKKESLQKIQTNLDKLSSVNEINYEVEQQKKDGTVFLANIKNSIIEIEGQKYIQCSIKDITETKETLEKAKESERVLSTLLNNLPGIAYRCKNDANWTMDFISEGCKKLTGYDREQLLGNKDLSYSDLIIKDDRDKVWIKTQEALKNKVPFEYEYKINTKNNTIRWVSEKGQGITDDFGNLLFLEGFISDITEKKSALEKVRENEKTFKHAFENAIIGKSIISLDGDFINVNKAFCEMVGYNREELLTFKFTDLTHAEDIKDSELRYNEFLKNKINEKKYFKRYVHKNGSIVYVEISTKLQMDELGTPQYFITDIIDVTEEQMIKAALVESEEKYKLLAEAAHEGIILINKEMELLFVNNYASGFIGNGNQKPEQLLLTNKLQNLLNIPIDDFVEVFKNNIVKQIETYIEINKRTIYLETNLVPIVDKNNLVTAILGVARDVTDKKIMRENLDRTREMLQLVINTIPQRVFWKDKNNKYLGCNKNFADDAGFSSAEEIIGKTDYDCIWANDAQKYIKDDNEVMNSGIIKLNFDEGLQKSDGYYWIKTSKIPLFDKTGNIFAVLGVYEDITEKRKTEGELKETLIKLERSNKELEQFAYVASHDLQEPLRMVSSYAQLLEKKYKDKLDDAANEYIFYAVDGARRMQKLINDLLDYSRITSKGKDFTKVNLSMVLGRVMINLYNKISEKNAIIANGFLPNVWGDEVQLIRVFQNLIDNSLKYTKDKESPGIYISSAEQGDKYVITVKDNGIGINEEYKEKIFKLFERLNYNKEDQGTGIGLSICKRIIERHGGDIWLDTTIQDGAAFCFTLKKHEE